MKATNIGLVIAIMMNVRYQTTIQICTVMFDDAHYIFIII
jgi:hypothetical protein